MAEKPDPVPEQYGSITPYLIVDGADEAIGFYRRAFGAQELTRLPMDGGVGHAEIRIGGSIVMLADGCPEMEFRSPSSYGGTPVSICLYVEDADRTYQRALAEGAVVLQEIADKFYGDRSGTVRDPFGHIWTISSRIEELSTEEMARRGAEYAARSGAG